MIRPKLENGLRVRFLGKQGLVGTPRQPGHWPAGTISPGQLGTIRRDGLGEGRLDWRIKFDGVAPRVPYDFGTFGPFLCDDFEIVETLCIDS